MKFPERPSLGKAAPWSPPSPVRRVLDRKATIYAHVDATLPLVSVRIQLPIGSVDDPLDMPGATALAAAMMQEASGDHSSLERSAAFDRLAARSSAVAGKDWTTVTLDVHRDRLYAALPLVVDAFVRPRFLEGDWERVLGRHVTGISQGLDDNGFVSAQVTPSALFGADHPYGHPVHGTIDGCNATTLVEAQRRWNVAHDRAAPSIAVTGDIDLDAFVERLGSLLPMCAGRARVPVVPVGAKPGRYFVDSPGSQQTAVRVALPGPSGRSPERHALDLARIALGGSFTSRLNQRLREEKGYTYGARLAMACWQGTGAISAAASVQADATAPALADTLEVLRTAALAGFDDDEIERSRAQALHDLVDVAESRAGLSGAYALEIEAGRDPMAVGALGETIAAVDRAAVNAATRQWIDPHEATIILVGDWSAVGESLEAFGDWTRVDPFGRPI